MIIILYTLTVNQRTNPYDQVGNTHNAGLDYIGTNIDMPASVAQLATTYMTDYYTTNANYPTEALAIIAAKGFNVTVDATNTLADIDLNGGYSPLLQKIFCFVDTFPPLMAASTTQQSHIIFNSNYLAYWTEQLILLLDEILDSGLPADQMTLCLIAHSILNYSYTYWNNAFNNTGGSNVWYTFLIAGIEFPIYIDWRQIIQQDIKGALLGAVLGGMNNPDNVAGGIVTGAAIAGMSASGQNMVIQVNAINAYNPA